MNGESGRQLGFVFSAGFLLICVLTFCPRAISANERLIQDKILDRDLMNWAKASTNAPGAVARVIVLTRPPTGLNLPIPERYNLQGVVTYFREASRQSLLPVLTQVQNGQLQGVRVLRSYWINASFVADVNVDGLKSLLLEPSVTKIYLNKRYKREPSRKRGGGKPAKNPSGFFNQFTGGGGGDSASDRYNFSTLGLDRLYKEKPQLIGTGAVVGVIDSGVDGRHPALSGKILKFYNVKNHTVSSPVDPEGHGTNTAGVIVGGDRKDNWIGVAPGAKMIFAGILEDFDAVLEGMQWFLEMELNPRSPQAVRVINCSWNTTDANDQEVFYRAISAWEAAGILPVFSVGNSGPNPGSVTPPHEHPGAFDVAAYGADGRIADFSSRGPAVYKGKTVQKPDLAAPGVDINTTSVNGQYEKVDGTSIATPHVTGAAAILLQVNPQLNPAQIKQILLQSLSLPTGAQKGQWNPNWGYGYLNIYNAVATLLKLSGVPRMAQMNFSGLDFDSPQRIEGQMFSEFTSGSALVEHGAWNLH